MYRLIHIYYRIAEANLSRYKNERPGFSGLRKGQGTQIETQESYFVFASVAKHFRHSELLRALSSTARAACHVKLNKSNNRLKGGAGQTMIDGN